MRGAQIRKHIDGTLGSRNLREAVKLPTGEDLNEWLAVNKTQNSTSLPQTSLSLFRARPIQSFVASPSEVLRTNGLAKFSYIWTPPGLLWTNSYPQDGGGSLRCAILGGNPVVQAQNNGWAGIVVNGCVRDVDEINGCDIGVRALASHPMKANKKGIGEKHVPITIAGTRISDGEWLYADTDGILISQTELSV
ncbi:hypothetical protein CMV_007502 [Castanea mollissima]|uniref:4-hydroxy-4-methyl-2-oxoglutarate aldolase n=1 Tax=Castanea mollissima TaxID=60419 RepID=A0A8J4RP11_9ROSI|nr:hypothetical protein CMV_007502 [Castanea mollissima]